MSSLTPDEIRRRVARRYRARLGFAINCMAFVGGSLFFWGIWLFMRLGILPVDKPSDLMLWPFIPMLMWGIALLIHGIVILIAPWFHEQQERAVEREMLRYANESDEKVKRGAVRLADDGELVYDDESPKRKVSGQMK